MKKIFKFGDCKYDYYLTFLEDVCTAIWLVNDKKINVDFEMTRKFVKDALTEKLKRELEKNNE